MLISGADNPLILNIHKKVLYLQCVGSGTDPRSRAHRSIVRVPVFLTICQLWLLVPPELIYNYL